MKRKILSIILSLAMVLTMIPMMGSVAFAAESEDNATYKISVLQPVVGQPIPENYCSISAAPGAPAARISDADTCLKAKSGNTIIFFYPGRSYQYDEEAMLDLVLAPASGEHFTGSETVSINGKAVPSSYFSWGEDGRYLYIRDYSFGVLKRTPVNDVYLKGYKPVKAGTTPAVLSVDKESDSSAIYTGRGYYTDYSHGQSDEIHSFVPGNNYTMHIVLYVDFNYSFDEIKAENIHIDGYDMPAEGVSIYTNNGTDGDNSYISIDLPAQTAQKNIYEFTIPEPKEGVLPAQAALKANDDISYEGIDWYKSKYEWSEAVKMKEGEKFEAGYDYYAQPKFSWKGE